MSSVQDDADDLRDVHLWRALEHAPDQSTAPDWRLRKAILKRARDAVGALDPDEAEAELELAARPWWRRAGSTGAKRSRMPWNAAFATLMIASVVALLWRRDPVIAPQLDSAPQASAPALAPQAREPSAPAQSGLTQSAPSRDSSTSSASSPPVASPAPQALAPAPKPPAAPAVPAAPVAPAPPPAASPQKMPQPVAPPTASPPAPPKRESADAAKSAQPVAPASPSADAAPRAMPQEAPGAARVAPPPSVRTEATEPPTFAALSRWNRITIARRGGESRTLQRADAQDLNALLGSAAISAVGSRPLSGTPEWRITLERDREVLAVFEVAPNQVRWREGKTPSATGTPSKPALAALREALQEAVQEPPNVPTPAPAPEPPRNP